MTPAELMAELIAGGASVRWGMRDGSGLQLVALLDAAPDSQLPGTLLLAVAEHSVEEAVCVVIEREGVQAFRDALGVWLVENT